VVSVGSQEAADRVTATVRNAHEFEFLPEKWRGRVRASRPSVALAYFPSNSSTSLHITEQKASVSRVSVARIVPAAFRCLLSIQSSLSASATGVLDVHSVILKQRDVISRGKQRSIIHM
jgi:hypothetical protein